MLVGGAPQEDFDGFGHNPLLGLAQQMAFKRGEQLDHVCLTAAKIVLPDDAQRDLFVLDGAHIPGLCMVAQRIDIAHEKLTVRIGVTVLVEAMLYCAIEARSSGPVAIVQLSGLTTIHDKKV